MWILPKQLHTSPYVPDTEALISDLQEQSQISAQSLLVRSKHSPVRTWLAKWKRDSWTQHLSGRILKPSLGKSFVESWISSLGVIPANHSAQQGSDLEKKTPGICGPSLQMELLSCDQVSVFLKMSRDISRWGCPTLLKTWQEWVTERRGEYSQRLKLAHLTRESGSSSWPTIRASEYKDVGPVGSKSHNHMLGKHYLCAVVTQEESGLADQGNLNTSGSRQESWATPEAQNSTGFQTDKQGKVWPRLGSQVTNGKLNPRWVETLMNLPVGWVMPSCTSPATIAPTNSDSSATE